MSYLIGVDIGTSGTKTVLFDDRGGVVASHTVEYEMYQPKNGWAEQNPEDWWNATLDTLRAVISKSGVSAGDIKGIGLSGQMHGLVLLDKEGNVLRPSIIWCDGRTVAECDEITSTIGKDRLIEISANPALPGFTAGKILWVRKNEPQIWEKAAHILLPKDYIRYKLTGEFATEVSDASGMNLLDVPKRQWSEEILQKLQIDKAMLPKMYESCEVTGNVSGAVADKTGLTAGTPVVGGAGDNAAAAVGTGVVKTGKAFTTIGTSGVIFAHADEVSIDPGGRVHTFCHAVPGKWTVMSCTLAAGLSLKWFRDQFCTAEMETAKGMGKDPYELMNEQIDRLPIGANKLIYLPYLMGERSPLLDADARGVFFGLSAIHTKYDMMRAVMEGVTYSQRNCLDVFREMGVSFSEMMATGGGGRSAVWRQMLADVYDCDVSTLQSKEGPALGVAILAGVGAGVYGSVPEGCDAVVKKDSVQKPINGNLAEYEKYYKLYLKLYQDLKADFKTLAQI
ncbi:xylulokinase [Christensenellaceae bacterium OttesenSCG-928-K19]|nr:xylulokinase [Christensenellaceae bacterium OttesenSCG-928-K19]